MLNYNVSFCLRTYRLQADGIVQRYPVLMILANAIMDLAKPWPCRSGNFVQSNHTTM